MNLSNNLMKRCINLYNKALLEKDKKNIALYKKISEILSKPDIFKIIDSEIAFNILTDLKYSKNEIVKIYSMLINN